MTILYTQRTEAPAVLAVNLNDVLAYLRLPASTPDSSLVSQFIDSATQAIELYCDIALISQKWRFVANKWSITMPQRKSFSGPDVLVRYPGCAIKELKIPRTPIISISSLKIANSDGTMEVISPSQYIIESVGQTVYLRNAFGNDLPNPAKNRFGIQIDATMGFGTTPSTVPPTIKQAIMAMTAYFYDNRGTSKIDIPNNIKEMINPWRDRS